MALIVPLIVLVLFWGVLILPQQRRVRAHAAFVAGLRTGDEVVTTAGVHGTIVDLDDAVARLRIAPDVVITIARPAIGRHQHDPAAEAPVDETPSDESPADAAAAATAPAIDAEDGPRGRLDAAEHHDTARHPSGVDDHSE